MTEEAETRTFSASTSITEYKYHFKTIVEVC